MFSFPWSTTTELRSPGHPWPRVTTRRQRGATPIPFHVDSLSLSLSPRYRFSLFRLRKSSAHVRTYVRNVRRSGEKDAASAHSDEREGGGKRVELLTYCYLGNSTKCSSPIPFTPYSSLSPSPSSLTPIFRVSHSPCTSLCTLPPLSLSLLPPFFFSSFFRSCTLSLLLSCSVHPLFHGPSRQSAARFGRRCNRLRTNKDIEHGYDRSPACRTLKREDHVESRILVETRAPRLRFSVVFRRVERVVVSNPERSSPRIRAGTYF